MIKHFWKFTVPSHILGVIGFAWAGIAHEWWFMFTTFLFWCVLSIGMEVGVHRLFSHKSFKTRRWVEVILMYLGTIAGQGTILFWCAVHRNHHPHSDTVKDLHSPIHGKWHAYAGWLIDDSQDEVSIRLVTDLMRDKTMVRFHKWYYTTIVLTLITLALVHPLLALSYLLASALCLQQNMFVNVLCHDPNRGQREYLTKDNSRNIPGLAVLTWGLSLHNNHHFDPGSYTFTRKDSQIDPSAGVIRLISTWVRTPRDDNA